MRAAGCAIALLGCLAFTDAASAASLRTNVKVEGARVRLSDLFSGLGPGQDTEIGDAPALGANYVVGGPQLTAIAAQFGVDWPEASPIVSITLTRAARMIGEADLFPLIRKGLDLPEESHSTITFDGFKPVAVPEEDQAVPVLVQLERPAKGTGHFSARFEIPFKTGSAQTVLVNGSVTSEVQALVFKHAIKAGQLLLPEDFSSTMVRSGLVPDDAVHDLDDAVGLEARSAAQPGQVVAASQLDHPQLVHRGSPIVVSFSTAGLHLTVSGAAMEAGGKGDTVHVFNPATRMVLIGRVIDRTQVEIIPGIAPVSVENQKRNSNMQNMPML
ncbi:flagellar basal body P-ring formation chaperone FlgA [Gluconobacter wancherniae]|uniref:flagellar basal body P-ring formation chaperone FlgA n=1 Tax=Gluconobacter wancherniae TaxID=1307955 RepID=UPI001B8B3D30|nr:flagellar basal body P-ring formation chaperone FlgA [Gluconobacter wancherniae]MBS1089531.1 flagellar basal body P-ring formation protein FlgA [Gluconobacter wancherniae]